MTNKKWQNEFMIVWEKLNDENKKKVLDRARILLINQSRVTDVHQANEQEQDTKQESQAN